MVEQETVDNVVKELEEYIDYSMSVLEAGEYEKLGELEEITYNIVAKISKVPDEDAEESSIDVGELMKKLFDLQMLMVEHQENIKAELAGLAINQQAHEAYAQANASAAAIASSATGGGSSSAVEEIVASDDALDEEESEF